MKLFNSIQEKKEIKKQKEEAEQRKRIERLAELETVDTQSEFRIFHPIKSVQEKKEKAKVKQETAKLRQEIAAYESRVKNQKKRQKYWRIGGAVLLGCFVIGGIVSVFDEDSQESTPKTDPITIVSDNVLSDEKENNTEEDTLNKESLVVAERLINAPVASADCIGKTYDEVAYIFKDAGFAVRVEAIEQSDKFTSYEDGYVISVLADNTGFAQDAAISESAVIVVSYFSVIKSEDLIEKPLEESTDKPSYTITEMETTMYVTSAANVRTQPNKDASKAGSLKENEKVEVTGKTDNGWYRVNYKGADGYIKGSLLSTEKVVAEKPTKTESKDKEKTESSDYSHSGSSGSGESGVKVPSKEDKKGNLVWVPTNGGTRYHSKSTCSNMINPMQVTIEHAEQNGYTPCGRCY